MSGASPENTPAKQERLREVAGMVLGASSAIAKKHWWAHVETGVIDLTAGGGYMPDRTGASHRGSPLILLDLVQGWPFRAAFVEKDHARAAELAARLAGEPQVRVIEGDHTDPTIIEQVRHAIVSGVPAQRSVFGLIYADCDGGGRVPWAPINDLRLRRPLTYLDVLVHVSANLAYKRPRHPEYLFEDVARLQARHLAVWPGPTDQQWLLIFGTGYDGFIDRAGLTRAGFLSEGAAWAALIEKSFPASDVEDLRAILAGQTVLLVPEPADYNAHRRHPYNRVVYALILWQAGWKCRRCGGQATQVHHRTYLPWGLADVPDPDYLEAICQGCHYREEKA